MNTEPLTLAIVIITSVVTIVAFKNASVLYRFILSVEAIRRGGEWWRIFTSALIHADYVHLIFNMMALLSFGSWLEFQTTPWQMISIYILSIAVGSTASLVVNKDNMRYTALGASGGVYGIIGAVTAAVPNMRTLLGPAWISALLTLAYSIYITRRGGDGVGHEAHLGGMVAGISLFVVYYPEVAYENIIYIAILLVASAGTWLALSSRKR